MKKIIGITGGIASGKSTVTSFLREKGYQVIDADQVVHDLQAKGGKLYNALVDDFGQDILQADEQLDRKKLANMIFENPQLAEQSSRIQDQMIRQALTKKRDELVQSQQVFFMDIPLLYELGYEAWFDEVWLVDVSEKEQLERLMARNNLSQEEARKRIACQMSLAEKRKKANILIDNTGTKKQTLEQVERLLHEESR